MSSPSTRCWRDRCIDRVKLSPLTLFPAGLLAGAIAFGTASWWQRRDHGQGADSSRSELEWLRREFHLSEDQFRRIASLHAGYQPTCAELCRRISEQNRRLQAAALGTNQLSPEVAALVAETGQVRDQCRAAMLAHLYAVAREMPPEEGRRYLGMMLTETCVLQSPHPIQAAPRVHEH